MEILSRHHKYHCHVPLDIKCVRGCNLVIDFIKVGVEGGRPKVISRPLADSFAVG
jgi:hypothetical protein